MSIGKGEGGLEEEKCARFVMGVVKRITMIVEILLVGGRAYVLVQACPSDQWIHGKAMPIF